MALNAGRTAVARGMWFVKMLEKGFPYRSIWARFTRVPGLGHAVERLLFEGDDIMILPREGLLKVAEEVDDSAGNVMLPSRVVEHFVERAGFLWIMNRCICRESEGCADYPVDLGCVFLGEAARGINPKLGREVTKEEALAHLERCREAGLYHLVGRNKLDSFWLKVSPGDRLLTICNCCTCCCLWRILPDVAGRIGSKVTRMPGVTVTVSDRCAGCGTCVREAKCIAAAITLDRGRAVIGPECRGCGRCAEVCPEGAIDVNVEDSRFIRSSIERIAAKVDVT